MFSTKQEKFYKKWASIQIIYKYDMNLNHSMIQLAPNNYDDTGAILSGQTQTDNK
jgi:hypothetical protein